MSRFLILLLVLISLSFTVVASDSCIYYFYGEDCKGCSETSQYLDKLQSKYPNLKIERFEIYFHQENYDLLRKYQDAYKIPESDQGIPIVFMLKNYFVGKGPITTLLETRIKENTLTVCPSLEDTEVVGVVGKSSSKSILAKLSFFTVTKDAFLSSFNPGTLALMIILLLFLISAKDEKAVLRKGLLFIASVYVAYLFYGLGMFTGFGTPGGLVISKIIAVMGMIIALAVMRNFFSSWSRNFKKPLLRLKEELKKFGEVLVSSYGVVIIGFVASLLTLTLNNETFMLIRELYLKKFVLSTLYPMMLYYLVIYVLFMILLLAMVYLLRRHWRTVAKTRYIYHERNAELWGSHYVKIINFASCIVILCLGLILLII